MLIMAVVLAASCLDAPPANPDVPTILSCMSEHAERTKRIRSERGFTAKRVETKSDVKDGGKDRPPLYELKETKEFRAWADAAGLWHQLTRKNGKPVHGAPEEQPKIDFIGGLQARYWVTLGTPARENKKGVDCWVLKFVPKSPVAPAMNNQELVMNRMEGTAWVDAQHFFVRDIDARVPTGFRQDLIGKLHSASYLMEQDLVDGVPAPRREETHYHYSVGFWSEPNERIVIEFLDRQFARPDSQAPTP